MRRPENVRRAAETIRRLHEGPRISGRFDSFRGVEGYAGIAARHGVRVSDDYVWAQEIAGDIETARGRRGRAPCHNDFLNANFIDDGERIRIVDWEYAGMGDPFFDLANFSINHEFGETENEALLAAYFGARGDAHAHTLRLMRFMSDFREAMWGVVQQGISELEFDFVAYASEHFERLRRTAAEPAFRTALAGVS
jgi:thiamine kinase-like enzyme